MVEGTIKVFTKNWFLFLTNGWFINEDLGAALRAVVERLRLVQLADTGQLVYRHDRIGHDRIGHDRIGLGGVPFEALPPLLAEIGYADWPVLEIIDRDPDSAITASVGALLEAGFGSFVPKS